MTVKVQKYTRRPIKKSFLFGPEKSCQIEKVLRYSKDTLSRSISIKKG